MKKLSVCWANFLPLALYITSGSTVVVIVAAGCIRNHYHYHSGPSLGRGPMGNVRFHCSEASSNLCYMQDCLYHSQLRWRHNFHAVLWIVKSSKIPLHASQFLHCSSHSIRPAQNNIQTHRWWPIGASSQTHKTTQSFIYSILFHRPAQAERYSTENGRLMRIFPAAADASDGNGSSSSSS